MLAGKSASRWRLVTVITGFPLTAQRRGRRDGAHH